MAAPTRFLSGVTQSASWQPLGNVGIPDPFFYAAYEEDFLHYNAGDYTVTASGGSVAATAANGSGGRVLLTTGATAGNFAELQLPVASFQYTSGKKLSYLTRLQVANASTSQFAVGLVNTNTTPLSSGITDGIYFSKAAGSTNIILNVVTGSASRGTATISALLANNTDVDLGFLVDRSGNIKIFAGSNLVGVKRPNTALLGPEYAIPASSLSGSITAVLLNPTIAVGNGSTAAAMTGVVDFQFAAMER